MKTYRIKKIYADSLRDLPGLLIMPTECWQYLNINVFDPQTFCFFDARNSLTRLPKNCDNRLVHAVLEQIQFDKITPEQIKRLKEYLKLGKQKDKNDEMKSDLKQSLKQMSLGFLIIAISGVAGFGLVFLFTILSPANASWMAICMLFVIGAATWGLLKLGFGCLKFGIEFFSICFRQKNTEQLPILQNELRSHYLQPVLPPPSYHEMMRNNKTQASAPDRYSEPPTYQQAIENSSTLSAYNATPLISIPESATLPGASLTHFTHAHSAFFAASHCVINDHLPPAYSHITLDKTKAIR